MVRSPISFRMVNQIPRTRAEWTAWAREAEQKSPGRFRVCVLALAAAVMVAHYAIDETGYHPEMSPWKSSVFWAGAWFYAVIPLLNWIVWQLVSSGRLKTLKAILVMAAVLCAGSVLAYCVPDMLRSIERMHLVKFDPTVEKWHWFGFRYYWRYWTPAVLVIGNIVLFLRWRRAVVAHASSLPVADKISAPLQSRGRLVLKAVTVTSAIAACGFTAFHLGLPRMPADGDIVSLARTTLVERHLRNDFDYLVHNTFSESQSLEPLLTHLKLADMQRRQFYSNLDGFVFQMYVLSPKIATLPLEEFKWRRQLWEHFYPRVRRESVPMEGAQIVVRLLRERVGIDPGYDYRVGVETIWTQQMTDETGFERIYVAALRSVGVASRIGESGQVELFDGNDWQMAPRPVATSFVPEQFPVPEGGLVNFRNSAGDDWPGD